MKKIISLLMATAVLLVSCDTVGKGNRAEAVNLIENRISYRGVIKQQTGKSLGEILEEEKRIHGHFLTTTTTSITTETTTTTTTIPTEIVYTVYKPSTNYVHLNTCRWFDNTCIEVTTSTLENVKRCTECNPAVEIVYTSQITDEERRWLENLVSNEYGATWISVYDKACIVASIMSQVNDSRFPNNIIDCINQSCTPWGFNPYGYHYIDDSIRQAVDYYFENKDTVFAGWTHNSWYGTGTVNVFYTV